jgi:hypothetical protein
VEDVVPDEGGVALGTGEVGDLDVGADFEDLGIGDDVREAGLQAVGAGVRPTAEAAKVRGSWFCRGGVTVSWLACSVWDARSALSGVVSELVALSPSGRRCFGFRTTSRGLAARQVWTVRVRPFRM